MSKEKAFACFNGTFECLHSNKKHKKYEMLILYL